MTTGAPPPSQFPPGGGAHSRPHNPARSAAITLLVAAALLLVGTISKSWVTASDEGDSIRVGPLGAEVCIDSRCVEMPLRGMDKDIEIFMTLAMLTGFAAAGATALFGGMVLAGSKQVPFPTKLANTVFVLALLSMIGFIGRMVHEKMSVSWAGFVALGGVLVGIFGMAAVKPFLVARAALPPGQPQPHANQLQPMNPYANQSQPMNPYANQSQPMNPYANQSQPMQPQHGSQPYQQPMQAQPQYGSQPYQQPMQPQPQYGSQPHQQPMQAQPQYGSQPHHMAPQQPPPQQQAVPNCPRCGAQLQFVAQYQRWFCAREQQYV